MAKTHPFSGLKCMHDRPIDFQCEDCNALDRPSPSAGADYEGPCEACGAPVAGWYYDGEPKQHEDPGICVPGLRKRIRELEAALENDDHDECIAPAAGCPELCPAHSRPYMPYQKRLARIAELESTVARLTKERDLYGEECVQHADWGKRAADFLRGFVDAGAGEMINEEGIDEIRELLNMEPRSADAA